MLSPKLHYENNHLFLTGDVNFTNVMQLYYQSLVIFKSQQITTIDLSGVTSNTSALLALLIEWKKLVSKELQIAHLPTQLNQIAMTAGLLDLFV